MIVTLYKEPEPYNDKAYRFWFHYNKPASQQAGRNILTVHYRGACYLVVGIKCLVPVASEDRTEQPRCVLGGTVRATEFYIVNGCAVIGDPDPPRRWPTERTCTLKSLAIATKESAHV